MRNANLILRFGLELAALASVAWWGAVTGEGVWPWVLGIAAPLAVILVWGAFVAPKRKFDLRLAARVAIEFLVWLAAAAALWEVGHEFLATAFLAVALVSGALNARWSQVAPAP
jgi:hypothetical protein